MPEVDQFPTKFLEVVDFAVVRNPPVTLFVGHGHAACVGEVQDTEPDRTQTHLSERYDSLVVGSPVTLKGTHLPDQRGMILPAAGVPQTNESSDSTHGV
jgi:hypothetical protein